MHNSGQCDLEAMPDYLEVVLPGSPHQQSAPGENGVQELEPIRFHGDNLKIFLKDSERHWPFCCPQILGKVWLTAITPNTVCISPDPPKSQSKSDASSSDSVPEEDDDDNETEEARETAEEGIKSTDEGKDAENKREQCCPWRFAVGKSKHQVRVDYRIPGRGQGGKKNPKQNPWAIDCYSIGRLLYSAAYDLDEKGLKKGKSAFQVSFCSWSSKSL